MENGRLVGEVLPGRVVPLDGAVPILDHAVGDQTPAVLDTLHIGYVIAQRQRSPLLFIAHIEPVAGAAVFSAAAVVVNLADNRDDVLFVHPSVPPLQLKAAIQELTGVFVPAVLQKLADVTQSLQVGRAELTHLREVQCFARRRNDLHQTGRVAC